MSLLGGVEFKFEVGDYVIRQVARVNFENTQASYQKWRMKAVARGDGANVQTGIPPVYKVLERSLVESIESPGVVLKLYTFEGPGAEKAQAVEAELEKFDQEANAEDEEVFNNLMNDNEMLLNENRKLRVSLDTLKEQVAKLEDLFAAEHKAREDRDRVIRAEGV